MPNIAGVFGIFRKKLQRFVLLFSNQHIQISVTNISAIKIGRAIHFVMNCICNTSATISCTQHLNFTSSTTT